MIELATFEHKQDNKPKRRFLPWSQLVKSLTTHRERQEKDGALWSPTVYKKDAARGNAGVASLTAAVGDFDDGTTYEEAKARLSKYEYVAHSTFSHRKDKPHFRVVIPFAQPVTADLWEDVKSRIDEHIFGQKTDPATKDPARIYYAPSCPPKASRFAEHHPGELLDPLLLPVPDPKVSSSLLERAAPQEGQKPKVALGKAALDFVANGAPLGEQRKRALSAARNYLSAGYSVAQTATAIWRGLQASPQDPDRGTWTYADAEQIAADLANKDAPPLKVEQPIAPRCEMTRVGMGYLLRFPALGVSVSVERIRRSAGGVYADLYVTASLPLVPEELSFGKIDLCSTTQRDSLVKRLVKRSNGGAGVDWDELLEDVCRKVIKMERAGEPFQVVGNLTRTEELTWLIKDFAPCLEAMTLYGDGASGKSMTALAMALAVLTGQTFVPGFHPLDTGPVLYLDWEAGPARIDQRTKMLCAGLDMAPVDVAYRRCNGPLCDQIEEVMRFCQSEGIRLVVVDSMEMAMAGSKGEDRDPNEPVQRLYAALRLLRCTVIIIDHVSKESLREKKGRRDPIGGVYKRNLARMAFELRRAEMNPPGRLDLALHNTKRNDDGPLLPQVGLSLVFDEGRCWFERSDKPDALPGAAMKVEERLALLLFKGPATASQLAGSAQVSVATVRTTLNRCEGVRFEKAGVLKGREELWRLLPPTEGPEPTNDEQWPPF